MNSNSYEEKIEKTWQQLKMTDKFFDLFYNEINEARQQENYATTLHGAYYWKGYREGMERALTILLKMIKKMVQMKEFENESSQRIIQDIATKQDNEKSKLILIDGGIDISRNPVTFDNFLDKFISWVEKNHWYFGGIVKQGEEKNDT